MRKAQPNKSMMTNRLCPTPLIADQKLGTALVCIFSARRCYAQ